MDLWKMGAPDPSPKSQPCKPGECMAQVLGGQKCGIWGCAKVKRVLLPAQFAKWWDDVAKRQGLALSPVEALKVVKRYMDKSKEN